MHKARKHDFLTWIVWADEYTFDYMSHF